jgi:hypothetical protein
LRHEGQLSVRVGQHGRARSGRRAGVDVTWSCPRTFGLCGGSDSALRRSRSLSWRTGLFARRLRIRSVRLRGRIASRVAGGSLGFDSSGAVHRAAANGTGPGVSTRAAAVTASAVFAAEISAIGGDVDVPVTDRWRICGDGVADSTSRWVACVLTVVDLVARRLPSAPAAPIVIACASLWPASWSWKTSLISGRC